MAKTYRTYVPEQNLLLPASLRDWLPDDHLCYFVSDVVDQLDLSAIESVYEEEDRSQPPYHPRMMTSPPLAPITMIRIASAIRPCFNNWCTSSRSRFSLSSIRP